MPRVTLLVCLLALGCQDRVTRPADATTAKALLTRYTRAEFEEAVKGKTKAEVIELLGRPASTTGGEGDTWKYDDVTTDPVSGKVDFATWIRFDNRGQVDRVHY